MSDFDRFKEQFREIQTDKAIIARSRFRKRTTVDRHKLLTIAILEDLAQQGDEYQYTYLGKEHVVSKKELKDAREKIKKKFPKAKGITLKHLLQKTDKDTKARSRDQIKRGTWSDMKASVVTIFTDKTAESTWKNAFHRTMVELKDYMAELLESPVNGSYKPNAKRAVMGPVGVYCDCEDFQYRKNYWITVLGAYISQAAEVAISRKLFRKKSLSINPKETSFPKITNPSGKLGPLCIHLVKAVEVLNRPMTINLIAQSMKKQAESVGPGLEPTELIDEDDLDAYEKQHGKEKIKTLQDAWIDKKAKSAYNRYNKAKSAFKSFFKTMLSKEKKRAEQAESKLTDVVKSVHKVSKGSAKDKIKWTAQAVGMSEKEVKTILEKSK